MPASPGTTSAARRVRTVTDDELSELVETAPSRRLMERPRPRADFLEGLSRTYDVLVELGRHRGRRYLTSWAELRTLCRSGDGDRALETLQRYTGALEEARLISVGPVWAGTSWALLVQIPLSAGPCSSTGGAAVIRAGFRLQMARFAQRRRDMSVGGGA